MSERAPSRLAASRLAAWLRALPERPGWIAALVAVAAALKTAPVAMGIDEGIWSTIGWLWWDRGLVPYRDAVDSKPPGVLLLFTLNAGLFGPSVWMPRALGVACVAGTTWLLYRLVRPAAGPFGAFATSVAFGGAMCWRSTDGGYPAACETFMVACSVLALSLIARAWSLPSPGSGWLALCGAGFALGAAVSFKQVALTTIGAFALLPLLHRREAGHVGSAWRQSMLIVACAAAGAMLWLAPILLSGASMEEVYRCVWRTLWDGGTAGGQTRNLEQIAQRVWDDGSRLLIFLPALAILPLSAAAQPPPLHRRWLVVWLLLECLASLSAVRLHNHMLRQAMPPLAIAFGLGAAWLVGPDGPRRHRATVAAVLLLMFVPLALPTRATFAWLQTGRMPEAAAVRWLRDNVEPDETVLIYSGPAGGLHALAGRAPASRHFHTILLRSPGAAEELRCDVEQRRPRAVLIDVSERARQLPPAWLTRLVEREYQMGPRLSAMGADLQAYLRER